MKTLMLSSIPPHLKGKIAGSANRRNSNMNDVLVGILAEEFGIPFEPTGARRVKPGPSRRVLLEMPDDLKDAIEERAHQDRTSLRNVAMKVICRFYRVKFEPTGRWPVAA